MILAVRKTQQSVKIRHGGIFHMLKLHPKSKLLTEDQPLNETSINAHVVHFPYPLNRRGAFSQLACSVRPPPAVPLVWHPAQWRSARCKCLSLYCLVRWHSRHWNILDVVSWKCVCVHEEKCSSLYLANVQIAHVQHEQMQSSDSESLQRWSWRQPCSHLEVYKKKRGLTV